MSLRGCARARKVIGKPHGVVPLGINRSQGGVDQLVHAASHVAAEVLWLLANRVQRLQTSVEGYDETAACESSGKSGAMAPVAPATGRNDAADHFIGAITACTLGPPGAKHELE